MYRAVIIACVHTFHLLYVYVLLLYTVKNALQLADVFNISSPVDFIAVLIDCICTHKQKDMYMYMYRCT